MRPAGTATNLENTQEMPPKGLGRSLHFAAGISYYGRTPLIFYNDKKNVVPDITVKDLKCSKLRKKKAKTDNEFELRLAE